MNLIKLNDSVWVRRGLLSVVFVLLSSSFLRAQSLNWVPRSASIPPGAVQVGQADGSAVYVCRFNHAGGLQPGKNIGDTCYIGFDGREVASHNYEVLVGDAGKVINGKCNIGFFGQEMAQPIYELFFPAAPAPPPPAVFDSPVRGTWKVFLGPTCPQNGHHCSTANQVYAYDLIAVDGFGQQLSCIGMPVYAPTDGTVTEVMDGYPNFPVQGENPAGNHIVIQRSATEYVLLAHFSPGTISVRPNQRVTAGMQVAKCGNSGNSSYPHVHLHMQVSPNILDLNSPGLPITFSTIRVWINGRCESLSNHHLLFGAFLC